MQGSSLPSLQSHPQRCDKPVSTIPLASSWHDLGEALHEHPCKSFDTTPLPPAPPQSTTKHIQNFSPSFLLLLSEPHDMPYQTRAKSCLPLPRSCVMRQPLNMQLACIYKSVRGSRRPTIAHGQDRSHPSGGACPNEPQGSGSNWNQPHPFPSLHKAQKASPSFHPLPHRRKDNVCVWTGKSWLHALGEQGKPLCCGIPCSSHPSAPEPSWA